MTSNDKYGQFQQQKTTTQRAEHKQYTTTEIMSFFFYINCTISHHKLMFVIKIGIVGKSLQLVWSLWFAETFCTVLSMQHQLYGTCNHKETKRIAAATMVHCRHTYSHFVHHPLPSILIAAGGGGGGEGDSKDRRERMESGTHTLLSLLSYLNDVSIT